MTATVAMGQFRPFELPRRSQPQPPVQPAPSSPAPTAPTPAPEPAPTLTAPLHNRGPFLNPFDEVIVEYTGEQVAGWLSNTIDDVPCRVSPAITFPAGLELNHYEITVSFTGTGEIKVSVGHAGNNDFGNILTKKHLHRPFQPARSDGPCRFSSPYHLETTAWILLSAIGDVQISGVQFHCVRGQGTNYGHTAMAFNFAGVDLPYRLLAPRQIVEGKRYPLVLWVSGSGGVGSDNSKQLEVFSSARYLYISYFNNDKFACYSLAPQMRPQTDIPAPYWPQGDLGKPTPEHPDWPLPNAEGWYTQATLALIETLINDPAYQIDPDRVYYTGFSYGGKACWEFLKAAPDRFAGALCVAGWAIGSVLSKPTDALKETLRQEATAYRHVPIRIFAGEKDAMRHGSQVAYEVLKQLGADCEYTEFPGADHLGITGRVWTNTKTMEWLFEQKKDSTTD
ncbi:MAG: hypothetical protein JW709_11105 [Sedimentisphaerales bacterium]|nr:hypothetical protein [Sedimentisphaerales bacterium]